MSREARFWRNVILIAITHTALLVAILHWSSGSKTANAQTITWLSGEANESAESAGVTASPTAPAEETPQSKSAPEKTEEDHSTPAIPKSDIQLPIETPTATATVAPKAIPRPSPRPTPKSTLKTPAKMKPSPKSKTTPSEKGRAMAGPSTAAKKKKTAEKKATEDKTDNSGSGGGNSSHSGAAANSSVEFNWYGNMLHDRFYREWAQPTTVVASGAKLSALAKIRIKIVRSSGNVVVDESIESIAKRVTKVDALPAGLGNGQHYDININFELNPER
jgi:outer membrane biosynthesis protein TonB